MCVFSCFWVLRIKGHVVRPILASSALFKTHLCYYATSIAKVRVTSGSILLEIIRKCKMTNREEVYSYTVVARCVYRQDPSTSDDCRRACN